MAYAEKRKDGYRLRASCGYDASGKQITRSKEGAANGACALSRGM